MRAAQGTDGATYADQQRVFDDLGQGVLNNAYGGYNSCLFAYGQTGAGKSYSMVGYGTNKGIVPISCDEIFKRIESQKAENEGKYQFQISIQMLEIYNEQVHCCLRFLFRASVSAPRAGAGRGRGALRCRLPPCRSAGGGSQPGRRGRERGWEARQRLTDGPLPLRFRLRCMCARETGARFICQIRQRPFRWAQGILPYRAPSSLSSRRDAYFAPSCKLGR